MESPNKSHEINAPLDGRGVGVDMVGGPAVGGEGGMVGANMVGEVMEGGLVGGNRVGGIVGENRVGGMVGGMGAGERAEGALAVGITCVGGGVIGAHVGSRVGRGVGGVGGSVGALVTGALVIVGVRVPGTIVGDVGAVLAVGNTAWPQVLTGHRKGCEVS